MVLVRHYSFHLIKCEWGSEIWSAVIRRGSGGGTIHTDEVVNACSSAGSEVVKGQSKERLLCYEESISSLLNTVLKGKLGSNLNFSPSNKNYNT